MTSRAAKQYTSTFKICMASKKDEIPDKIEEFADGLRKIFGLGATVIEKAIIKSLYAKIGMKHEGKKGYSFLAYVKDAENVIQS